MASMSASDLVGAVSAFVTLRSSPGPRWLQLAFQHAVRLDCYLQAIETRQMIHCMRGLALLDCPSAQQWCAMFLPQRLREAEAQEMKHQLEAQAVVEPQETTEPEAVPPLSQAASAAMQADSIDHEPLREVIGPSKPHGNGQEAGEKPSKSRRSNARRGASAAPNDKAAFAAAAAPQAVDLQQQSTHAGISQDPSDTERAPDVAASSGAMSTDPASTADLVGQSTGEELRLTVGEDVLTYAGLKSVDVDSAAQPEDEQPDVDQASEEPAIQVPTVEEHEDATVAPKGIVDAGFTSVDACDGSDIDSPMTADRGSVTQPIAKLVQLEELLDPASSDGSDAEASEADATPVVDESGATTESSSSTEEAPDSGLDPVDTADKDSPDDGVKRVAASDWGSFVSSETTASNADEDSRSAAAAGAASGASKPPRSSDVNTQSGDPRSSLERMMEMTPLDVARRAAAAPSPDAATIADSLQQFEFEMQELKARTAEEQIKSEQLLAKPSLAQLTRLQNDLWNAQQRNRAEKQQMVDQVTADTFSKHVLPIVDNFERLVQSGQQYSDKLGEGELDVHYVYGALYKQLQSILANMGLTEFDSVGQAFDPMLHEAIMREEDTTVPDGTVLQEFRKGYMLKEELVRPAMVKVSYR